MEIIHLPHDLFLLIVARLTARTIVLCRRVSKGWNDAFTDQDLNLQLLKDCFPRCREMRIAFAAAAAGGEETAMFTALKHSPSVGVFDQLDGLNGFLKSSNGTLGQDWTSTFALVASRYHHLRTATPRSISKIRLGTNGPDKYRFYGSAIWDRYLRLDNKAAPFHYPDPSWCYAQEEGLLVYHVHPDDVEDTPRTYIYPWRLLDVETGEEVEVAFPQDDERVVRRVRLAAGVLVFEWCERLAYHQLNDREECHRHYVTAFDVVRKTTSSISSKTLGGWDTIQRAEWKLHFLGLPLNHKDRFLSTHTATHYAVYVWQPNRSPWGEDDPIESVIVWDISSSKEPPRIIRRMTWPVLAFYGVRQRATPRLRGLGMDERNLFFIEEEHRWERGGHSSLSPPRVHLVRTTGVPIIPGPVELPASREYNAAENDTQLEDENDQIVQGPPWLDKCGANGDVNLSFCSRLDAPSYFHPTDTAFCTTGSPGLWNGTLPPGTRAQTTFTEEISAAMHASAARWPGWAPCWRHEEFPYLTVSEMVDFRAGVRVTARHCFMLETLSVHARPSLSIGGLGGLSGAASSAETTSVAQENIEDAESTQSVPAQFKGKLTAARENEKRKTGQEEEMDGDDEVQFADEMWDRLLGKGYICGDERWLIGEDREGSITIARF